MSISPLRLPLIIGVTITTTSYYSITQGDKALGQIVPDNSLPTPSIVVPQTAPDASVLHQIQGGTAQGGNLFHSFSRFSVPSSSTASFENGSGITNIFTRVTGSKISAIDGRIQTQGTANFFLLNPNGILFGPEARLDIGGSFIASSAERIIFADGFQFATTDSGVEPLLTISAPVGLGFGSTPGALVSNADVTLDTSGAFPRAVISSELAVPEGRTLGLIGGKLDLNGGQFLAPEGRIELASVEEPSIVGLHAIAQGFRFNVDGIDRFDDIHLANLARVDVSGDRGGAVSVHGRNVILSEGAQINAVTLGSFTGDDITIQATESLQVLGTTTIPGLFEPFIAANGVLVPQFSSIATDTIVGNAGDIDIITSRLAIRDGARITANADPNRLDDPSDRREAVTGRGGDIIVNASDSVEVTGFTDARLVIPDIPIPPEIVEANGSSILSTLVTNQAEQAGDIIIHTDNVLLRNSGLITTLTTGIGDGGNIMITARDSIVVEGIRPGGLIPSDINASTVPQTEIPALISLGGNGGTILLTARELLLQESGSVSSNTSTGGSGGSVVIDVSLLEISELASIQTDSSGGPAGSIEILSDILRISDNGEISVAGGLLNPILGEPGLGQAGTLTVEANTIMLDNGRLSGQTASDLGGGNLILNANDIFLQNSSSISAEATGTATGGNITINAIGGYLAVPLFNNSDILAIANEGRGGEININVDQIFGFTVQDNPANLRNNQTNDISASSAAGPQGIVNLNTFNVDPSQGLIELTVRLADPPALDPICRASVTGSAFTYIGRGGIPTNPSNPLGNSSPWEDWYISVPSTDSGSSTDSALTSTLPSDSHSAFNATAQTSITEAQDWVKTDSGHISLIPNSVPHPSIISPPPSDC